MINYENKEQNVLYIDSHERDFGKDFKEYIENNTHNKKFTTGKHETLIERVEVCELEIGDYIYNDLCLERKTIYSNNNGDFKTSVKTREIRSQLMEMKLSDFKHVGLIIQGDFHELITLDDITHINTLWRWTNEVAILPLPCENNCQHLFNKQMGNFLCNYNKFHTKAFNKTEHNKYPLNYASEILGFIFNRRIAKRIIDETGIAYPFEISFLEDETLLQIPGIGEKKLEKFHKFWNGNNSLNPSLSEMMINTGEFNDIINLKRN